MPAAALHGITAAFNAEEPMTHLEITLGAALALLCAGAAAARAAEDAEAEGPEEEDRREGKAWSPVAKAVRWKQFDRIATRWEDKFSAAARERLQAAGGSAEERMRRGRKKTSSTRE